MTGYGPLFFQPEHSEDFIPANPDLRKDTNPNRRESQVADKTFEYRNEQTRWRFNSTTNEILSPSYLDHIVSSDVNEVLALAKQREHVVHRLVFHLSPAGVERHFHELRCKGFERCEIRERAGNPQTVWVGPAKQWK